MTLRAFRRQFAILYEGRASLGALPFASATAVDLGEGWRLHHDRDLAVVQADDADGRRWTIAGRPLPSLAGPASLAELVEAHRGPPAELYASWAGRWLAVVNGEVHPDAGSLLSCFVARGGGTVACASAVGLLTPRPTGWAAASGWAPVHGKSPDWYPMPRSRAAGIDRLLPSQRLRLVDGAILPRPLAPSPARRRQSAYGAVRDTLAGAVTMAHRPAAQAHVALTAGFDSRVLLALCTGLGLPVSTFTIDHGRLSEADRAAAPLLAELAGVRHRFVPLGSVDPSDEAALDEHTGRHLAGIDRTLIPAGCYSWAKPGTVLLRGGAFEAGRGFYHGRLPAAGPADGAAIVSALKHPPEPFLAAAFDAWLAACPAAWYGQDWRDRFYIEQRVAGWLSGVEQAFDVLDASSAVVANSMDFYHAVLRLPDRVRRESLHQVALVSTAAPALLGVPFNGRPPGLKQRAAARLGRLSRL